MHINMLVYMRYVHTHTCMHVKTCLFSNERVQDLKPQRAANFPGQKYLPHRAHKKRLHVVVVVRTCVVKTQCCTFCVGCGGGAQNSAIESTPI